MKKFLLPFQNMVQADLFSGSLAVWNLRRNRSGFYSPPISEPREARQANSVRAISNVIAEFHVLARGYLLFIITALVFTIIIAIGYLVYKRALKDG